MLFATTLSTSTEVEADLLAIGVPGGSDLDALDATLGAGVGAWARSRKFTGAEASALGIPGLGRAKAREILLVGLGDGSLRALRTAAGKVGRDARTSGARQVALALGAGDDGARLEVCVEGFRIGNYAWDRHKPEKDRTPATETLTLVGTPPGASTEYATKKADLLEDAQDLVRDLVNAPASDIYPETLVAAARKVATLQHVTLEVWDVPRLQVDKCVGILAVGQGSVRPPRMARLTYNPPNAKAHVAIVGKGITFDSGGLCIKPADGMLTMRCDMAGAATVIGTIKALAERGVPIRVDGWIACAENMLGGDAYKLGDVLTYANGVTVEVHNTDAEGRLVLADALIHACKVPGVTDVVDLATLTGACVVAVGPDFTGMFTSDDGLAGELDRAATAAGEGLWRLPLHAAYQDMIKSDFAQIKNVGGRLAGASTAALFLQHFVSGPRWAHLDIAGPAFLDRASGPYMAGGTGQMVRTLMNWFTARVA